MIDVSAIITKLQTDTAYTVSLPRTREFDLQELYELPLIYVGYSAIDSKHPTSPIEYDLFNQHGEDLVQTFDVQIVCRVTELTTIWKNVYTSLIGFNPSPNEEIRSGLTYGQGGVMGLANSNLWWLDRWRLGFPTVFVNF